VATASSGFEPVARVWDVATGREVDPNLEAVLWAVAGRTELRKLANDRRVPCGHAAFSPDGRTVAGAGRVWDVATGRLIVSFPKGARDWCMPAFTAAADY
jgi:WD40 repeat protein